MRGFRRGIYWPALIKSNRCLNRLKGLRMSRRTVVQKRPVPSDSVYNSRLISMLMRRVMHVAAKKSIAATLFMMQ
jgi:hypothetical protein